MTGEGAQIARVPWKGTCHMDEKRRFIEARLEGKYSMTELCSAFGISRKTGYKWWNRFQERGHHGLTERSHEAHTHPNATSELVVKLVIAARRAHPTWGPRKLRAWMLGRGHKAVPAASTRQRVAVLQHFGHQRSFQVVDQARH